MLKVYIVGGYGTLAGIDIVNKMINHYTKLTDINTDGDNINFILDSCPLKTLHDSIDSCNDSFHKCLERIKKLNNNIILGIGCNTMHLCLEYILFDNNIKIINMIESTCKKVNKIYNNNKIYLLSTKETYTNNIYQNTLKKYNLRLENNSEIIFKCIKKIYTNVKKCILDRTLEFDIILDNITDNSIVILGCTELPIVKKHFENKENIKIVDCNQELGNALATEYLNERL